jgi:hypothetical protein
LGERPVSGLVEERWTEHDQEGWSLVKVESSKRTAISWSVGLAAAGLACVSFAAPALSAGGTVHVGSLAVVSGTATGSISGFQPNAKVTINGNTYVASPHGTVTLDGAPLGNSNALTIGYQNGNGTPQTASTALRDAATGLPLSLAQLDDAIPDVTVPDDATPSAGSGTPAPSGGPSGGGTTGGSNGTGGSALSPTGDAMLIPGAVRLGDGSTSIPASSVVAPYRLVIQKVAFSPRLIRTRAHRITVRYQVRDTRGMIVRGAEVYMRSLPLKVISTPGTHRTSKTGWVTFTFTPTKRLKLQKGGRVNLFVRAITPGASKIGGTSTRRLVSIGISPATTT